MSIRSMFRLNMPIPATQKYGHAVTESQALKRLGVGDLLVFEAS